MSGPPVLETKRLPVVDVHPPSSEQGVEVSFVMPCLNEAQTLAGCIEAAMRCIRENNLAAEVIVADNGSTDGSQEIARLCGARVVPVAAKGYGSALMGGFAAARGRYLIMGDSDQSYDFGEAMKFVVKLREGHDLVMGNRFESRGGGGIMPGAMPTKNRYIGNPVLTWIGRVLFHCPVSDFHCGLRGFTKAAYEAMAIRTTGMEFASEIVIKATLKAMKIAEVPITLHKDGRSRPPHLRPWRDGWRHLRFMLCLSPRWTLFAPGAALMGVGLVLAGALAFGTVRIGWGRGGEGVTLDVHTLLVASLMIVIGYQATTTALAMRIYGVMEEVGPPSPLLARAFRIFNLERGLLLGLAAFAAGLGLIGWVALRWASSDFGPLNPQDTLRPVIIGATLAALGGQTVLMSFVYAMFRMRSNADVGV